MKRFIIVCAIMFLLCCCQTQAATTTPGDIASASYNTLEAAHSYYTGTLGQSCDQCNIAAKEWVQSGDYGCGILAHGTFNGAFWMIMKDTHWLIVNGTGSTGDWVHGDSELAGKFSQQYVAYGSGVHPWSGYEGYPVHVIHGETMGDIGEGIYSNLPNVVEFYWGGNSCKEIGDYAFYDMNALQSIVIDDNIERIKKQAFVLNPVLQEVTFGSGLKYIGNRAFRGIPIRECRFPSKLKSIGTGAFAGCSKLRNIYWGKAGCKVGSLAFNNCYGLGYRTVHYIPSYIKTQKNSFRNCGVNQ